MQTGDYPESIKYHQIAKEEGPILTKFLDWLAAEGYDICGFNTYTEEYVPYVFGSGEALLREYAGVDSERLELERRAMIESLARANRK